MSWNIILQSINKCREYLPFKTIYNKLKILFTFSIQQIYNTKYFSVVFCKFGEF